VPESLGRFASFSKGLMLLSVDLCQGYTSMWLGFWFCLIENLACYDPSSSTLGSVDSTYRFLWRIGQFFLQLNNFFIDHQRFSYTEFAACLVVCVFNLFTETDEKNLCAGELG
jgi:hypothetical protein